MVTITVAPSPVDSSACALTQLAIEDLPTHSRQLPCARCGRTDAGHGGRPPDCDGFVRPGLPTGHAYVDELREGDWFRFLSRAGLAPARVAHHEPLDLDESTGLMQVRSSVPGSPDVVHLVQKNTIVLVPPASAPIQPGSHADATRGHDAGGQKLRTRAPQPAWRCL